MSRFKVGDLVTLVNTDRLYKGIMPEVAGKIMIVRSYHVDDEGTEVISAGVPGDAYWNWNADDLRLVSETQAEPTDPAPAASEKPIRRGDLVVSNGDIYVVIETNHADGGYWIHAMTGKGGQDYARAKELTRIGSIRKKVKRLKAAIAKAGGAV